MTHPTDERLLDHRFQLLDDAARAEIDAHLADCADCRDRVETLVATVGQLDLLADEMAAEPGPELLGAITAIDRPSRRVWPFLAAGIAALLALGGLAWLWHQPEPQVPSKRRAPGEIVIHSVAPADAPEPWKPGSNIELNILPRRENLQLTIYNEADLTLVRERRNLTFRKGWNWLQYMWANTQIDPTSLDLNAVGNPQAVRVQLMTYPPRTQGIGRWLVWSDVAGPVECEITYFTAGIRWRAFHMLTLSPDETTLQLETHVRVDNHSGETYDDATTRLVLGQVNMQESIATLAARQDPYGSVPTATEITIAYDSAGSYEEDERVTNGVVAFTSSGTGDRIAYGYIAPKEILKQSLSEYVLYTIEGRETLENQWGKRLPSLDASVTDVTNVYKYDTERYGSEVRRILTFANGEEAGLGQSPMPQGELRVYAETAAPADGTTHLRFVGRGETKFVPVEQEAEVDLGATTLVTAQPRLQETATENLRYDRNRDIIGWDTRQEWTLELANTRDIPVRVEATIPLPHAYWQHRATSPRGVTIEKHDAKHLRITVDLAPGQRLNLPYQLRLFDGTRQEEMNK